MQGSGERKCAAFAVAVSACAVLFAQARPAVPELVSGPRPLVKVVDLLQARFGKIVTYEEPLILNPDDLQLYGPATSEWSTGPKTRNFPMRSIAGLFRRPQLDARAISRIISAYNNQNLGVHFRAESSPFGFHIIGMETRDGTGRYAQTPALLDAVINIPEDRRTPSDTFEAICLAVQSATGIQVNANVALTRPYFDPLYRGAGDSTLTWGVAQRTAREALIDFLEKSATSFSWKVMCQPAPRQEHRLCVLSLVLVNVAVPDRNGKMIEKPLKFDRCAKCPVLLPQPPEEP